MATTTIGAQSENVSVEMEEFSKTLDALTFGAGRFDRDERRDAPLVPLAIERIAAAVDGSPTSADVLAWARALAADGHAQTRVMHVAVPRDVLRFYGSIYGQTVDPRSLEDSEKRGQDLVDQAIRAVGSADTDGVLLHGPPVTSISESVAAHRSDLVILGARGSGKLRRFALGGVANGVKDHVRASVLIVRGPPMPEKVLIAVDGSRASALAAELGVRFARGWGAHAKILHVLPPLTDDIRRDAHADSEALRAFERAPPPESGVDHVLDSGNAADVILAHAERDRPGLIVMGTRGLGGLRSLVAGSVSNRVANEATCSVLLAKETRAWS